MADCLKSLWHHTVVGGNYEHHNVGDACAAGTHLAERCVTWGVDEGNELAVFFHLIRTDVLGDATGFTSDHIGLADSVEQRGFAVVDVAHDRDDRRTRRLLRFVGIVRVVKQSLEFHLFLLTWINEDEFGANFEGKQFHLLVSQRHGGSDHLALLEQKANYVDCTTIKFRCELLRRRAALDHDGALRNWGVALCVLRRLQ